MNNSITGKYPANFFNYCNSHPEKFSQIKRPLQKYSMILIMAVSPLLIFHPGAIPQLSPILVSILGAIGLIYCGLKLLFSPVEYRNLHSGGVIKLVGIKRFDKNKTKDDKIIEAFEKRNFDFLATTPGAEHHPLQLFIFEDKKGKEIYLLMMQRLSSSIFCGVSDVVTLSGTDYEEQAGFIKSIVK